MRYQLLQIPGPDPPALVEAHGRKRGKFIPRKTEKLETRSSTLESNPLLADGANLHRSWRQLSRNLAELFRGNRNCALGFYIRRDFRADGNVQVCPGELDPFIGRLEQDVRQYRQGGFGRNARGNCGETFLKFFSRDREAHPVPFRISGELLVPVL